jgi:opacity protein-like surface antigen
MKKLLAALLSLFAFPAFAADFPVANIQVKAPPALIVASPTGFYLGGFVGGGMSTDSFDFVVIPGTGNLHPTGVQVGAKVGYLFMVSPGLSFGLELDAAYDINRSQSNPCAASLLVCESRGSWLMTQRGLIGWNIGTVTPYITGGVAERLITTQVTGSDRAREWLVGWTAGGGVRMPIWGKVSLDVSYLYINYNKNFVPADSPPIFPTTFTASSEHVARAAMNFGF